MPQYNTSSNTSFNRIILIEDEVSFRDTIQKYLQKKGYEVTVVGSAGEFFREFEQEHFALAIIDVGLPDQNGLALTQYVRSNSLSRVILITGDSSLDARIKGYNAGADVFLTKPVSLRLLDAALTSQLMKVAEQNVCQLDMTPFKSLDNAYSPAW